MDGGLCDKGLVTAAEERHGAGGIQGAHV